MAAAYVLGAGYFDAVSEVMDHPLRLLSGIVAGGLTVARVIAGPIDMINSAPTTGRSATSLSKAYGYGNLNEMIESLPADAWIADFGSGKSNLGYKITAARNDVNWLNVDIRTGSFKYSQRQQKHSSPNLQFVQADVLNMPFAEKSLDRVYSSFLLQHIVLESEALARETVQNMGSLLKADGEMRIHAAESLVIKAEDYYENPDKVSEQAVEDLRLKRGEGMFLKFSNTMRGCLFLDRLP